MSFRILDERISFVHAVREHVRGVGSVTAAAILLQKAEAETGVRILKNPSSMHREAPSLEWIREHLNRFLDQTHLLIAGGDLLTWFHVCDADGIQYGMTWREWGALVADWANTKIEKPGDFQVPQVWTYLDFYSHGDLDRLVPDYESWRSHLLRVIDEKCRMDL